MHRLPLTPSRHSAVCLKPELAPPASCLHHTERENGIQMPRMDSMNAYLQADLNRMNPEKERSCLLAYSQGSL